VSDAIETVRAAAKRHGKLLMVGGMSYDCPLRITGFDSAFLFQAAKAAAEEAHRG
jgi:hypothetical protein